MTVRGNEGMQRNEEVKHCEYLSKHYFPTALRLANLAAPPDAGPASLTIHMQVPV